jgi:hypothetical protein
MAVVAVMALVGLLGFSGQAEAQAKSFDNYMAWWDSLDCPKMINVVVDTTIDTSATQDGGAKSTLGEFRWCGMWADLATADQTSLKNAVTMGAWKITRSADDEFISLRGWWGDLDGGQQCLAVGRTAAATPCTSGGEGTAFNALTVAVSNRATAAGEALMKSSMMTDGDDDDDMDDAPALPLVGVGLLGLVLAGRGAWLRRRA